MLHDHQRGGSQLLYEDNEQLADRSQCENIERLLEEATHKEQNEQADEIAADKVNNARAILEKHPQVGYKYIE